MLTLALSKGRILEEALPLLAAAGVQTQEDPGKSRKLIIGTSDPELRLVVIRAADVPTFVEHGGADLGVAGRDVLLEYAAEGLGEGLYEPVDLGISRCRLMVAAPEGAEMPLRPRVATKYPCVTRQYYAGLGVQPRIIKLYGSMELAPLVGLADCIVDLVDTGRTLAANGLVPIQHITDISARLVVNKASMKMRHVAVKRLLEGLAAVAAADAPARQVSA
jgi:ATP phosphoribosyltransferase